MRGPFAAPNYIILFRLPSSMDPSRLIAALTHSEDEADPKRIDAGFHLYILNFAGPGVTGLYAVERFAEPITLQKAALVHAPDPKARVDFYNERKTIGIEVTLQNQLLRPFDRAMFIVGGESPPSGPLLGQQDLDRL